MLHAGLRPVIKLVTFKQGPASGKGGPAVQLKRPKTKNISPSDRLHLAVWDNDAAKVQNLVLHEVCIKFGARLRISKSFYTGYNEKGCRPTPG
jgi:hypothetical protein